MKDAALHEDLLSRLSEFVDLKMALHFPKGRWNDLERMTLSAAQELDPDNPETFIERLISTPLTDGQMEALAQHLTIGETYFWREPRVLEALEGWILPELIRSRERSGKRLRIWSAGCSTGEECYSIAIALRRTLPSSDDWDISILATDINARALRKAAQGQYGEWSFRNAPPWLAEGFFRRGDDGRYTILPEIRRMVSFAYLNLAEDEYPSEANGTSSLDMILCRNVLMYFSSARAHPIVTKLHRSLVDGGWLMVGASELSQSLFRGFACVRFPGSIVYRKEADAPRSTSAPVLEAPGEPEPPADAPQSRSATASSVRALADQGRLPDALALCEKAIAGDRLGVELRYLEATILLELSREEAAVVSLGRTLYLDPDHVPAHFAMGALAMRRGDSGTGRRCLENALALLDARGDEDIVPESEGLTAGRFREIIRETLRKGASA
jgi:chemotaxis protein methyltransferase CheR